MTQEISSKNTKNQILEAYEGLLTRVKEQKSEEPKKMQEEAKKQAIGKELEAAVMLSLERIETDALRDEQ